MSHYFIHDPTKKITERELTLNAFGYTYSFLAASGLFSCDEIDHASLILLQHIPSIKGDLLDLGCGYGVIGIILAKLNDIILTQSDINPLALRYAEINAKRNNITTNLIHSDSFENIPLYFDTITLNPPIHAGKETCFRMYKEAAHHLNAGGSFYIVIQKKHGASSTLDKLKELFSLSEILYRKKGINVVRCSV